ncbi:hypothetical protein PoB_004988100 [Plakobranchus ocellatus]|uniref:Uncharacterized protein n=1 Tax=Plakobranchus ocellatus TaxID=259542 RepID=A0AAV4BSD6_9GAST|nr:hypothetical protein PoB_004988100 [Plakobranchus ocellatus]
MITEGPKRMEISRVFDNVRHDNRRSQKDGELSDISQSSPQQGDLRLSGPPSGQGAGSGARTRDRRVPADLRAHTQATVLPTPP